MAYLDQPRTFGAIVASFFVVFLPLAWLELVPNDFHWLPHLLLLQGAVLGVSHFFITLALYGNAENLRYFNRSLTSRLVYFVLPLCCLAFFAAAGAWQLEDRAPFSTYLSPAIRLLDFVHVGRQSFGVTQLLKRDVPGLPARLRRLENGAFVGLALMQWETFLMGGRFVSTSALAAIPAAVVGAALVASVSAYLRHGEEHGFAAVVRPLVYLLLQAICAAAAVYRTRLYLIALTMHYVEYHVLISPRIFASGAVPAGSAAPPNDASSNATPRARVVVFYAALIALVVAFEGRRHVSVSPSLGLLVHCFDGIFVVHYFVEAFVWRFSNPYFRARLAPLYFGGEGAPSGRSSGLPSVRELACVAAVAAAATWFVARSERVAAAFDGELVRPMRAELRRDWAVDLAEHAPGSSR